jgi:hypothetical protein
VRLVCYLERKQTVIVPRAGDVFRTQYVEDECRIQWTNIHFRFQLSFALVTGLNSALIWIIIIVMQSVHMGEKKKVSWIVRRYTDNFSLTSNCKLLT